MQSPIAQIQSASKEAARRSMLKERSRSIPPKERAKDEDLRHLVAVFKETLRFAEYQKGRIEPLVRAEQTYLELRDKVRAEDALLDRTEKYPAKSSPTDEDEAMHAQWSANQAAERDELAAEYDEHVPAVDETANISKGG